MQVAFWIQALLLKAVFDYFVIIRPLIYPVILIGKRNWLACVNDFYTIAGTHLPLHCVNGDWVRWAEQLAHSIASRAATEQGIHRPHELTLLSVSMQVLIAVRLLPFIIVLFIDTQVFYQITVSDKALEHIVQLLTHFSLSTAHAFSRLSTVSPAL